ncbi:YigZ family protein [Methanoculleus sp. FWC-SCC1]|uniref:YigZ family protein n=1 Tax=Methanoculleus frigidifontis TaxID=2584085 RepID=A0ABT8MAA7_9EURY|nr:YigZ family protein [Methanoculleus sp. FWC-SCC1]MDN7024868.1 YigZ family protein [Methanoculleus sp. FWC-SCC1]
MRESAAAAVEKRRSRFYAHLYEIEGTDDLKIILEQHRRCYRKATHHCAALRIAGMEEFRSDREVGQPGRVLLDVLRRHALDRHALVVSRIFGGVKLGPGGVARAFRDAGELAAAAERER